MDMNGNDKISLRDFVKYYYCSFGFFKSVVNYEKIEKL